MFEAVGILIATLVIGPLAIISLFTLLRDRY